MFTFGQKKDNFVFGTLEELRTLIRRLNARKGWKYSLVREKSGWLIEEDLGDEYLNYAMISVENGKVMALSADVLGFLEGMKRRAH
ncbi:hypothetical protein HZA41_02495 [Candidatus Peregrinibacteria bacterium]|nr:hypothetical protein [Candidatus Peregrinibacteria bacterium]